MTSWARRAALSTAMLVVAAGAAHANNTTIPTTDTNQDELSWEFRQELEAALNQKLGEYRRSENADGRKNKRTNYSKVFKKIDDSTYLASYHVHTAEELQMTTERFEAKIVKDGGSWKVGDVELKDEVAVLERGRGGGKCYHYDSFTFDKYGLDLSSSDGVVCEYFNRDKVQGFEFSGRNLRYDYTAPNYLDYYTQQKYLMKNREKELVFDPETVLVNCDPVSCESLLDEHFKGVKRLAADQRDALTTIDVSGLEMTSALKRRVNRRIERREEAMRDNPFARFAQPRVEERRQFTINIAKNDNHAVGLSYDSMGGYELQWWVFQDTVDPLAVRGTLYGYYTDETLANTDPYEIDKREDFNSRWFEVRSVKGDLDLGLEDPETYHGSVDFEVVLKQDMPVLPFFVATQGGDNEKKASLSVNSIRYEDSDEMTWVRTSPFGGLIVLPGEMKAGTVLPISMDFTARAIQAENHAYNGMARGGWLPFVRFGDFIDEMELTIRTPSQYKTLGIGRRVWDKIEGDTRVSHWVADSPVVFPTIIFGRYKESKLSDKAQARRPNGDLIPVTVHADEVSAMQFDSYVDIDSFEDVQAANAGARGIRDKQLDGIAVQAAQSINLYQELSGVEYPYGELNLVNDPVPALYGQAPSSLVYLGSRVFRGEGEVAGAGGAGNSTNTARFLKSVTAHEVGHQWWGSAIANKNFRNYWFVETMAEYFSAIYLEQAWGEKEYMNQVKEWEDRVRQIEQWVSVQGADTRWQGPSRGAARQAAIYNKGPYAMHILRKMINDDVKFFAGIKGMTTELAKRREIVTRDMQQVMEAEFGKAMGLTDANGNPAGLDLEWFFDQWIRSPYIPQYKFDYDVRRNEEGKWLIEGTITQRLTIGSESNHEVIEGKVNRGMATIRVQGKSQAYDQRVFLTEASTPVRLLVAEKPRAVTLNPEGDILALPTVVNKSSW